MRYERNKCVEALITEYRASLNKPDIGGFTPLANATFAGNLESVTLLLDAGADMLIKGRVHHSQHRKRRTSVLTEDDYSGVLPIELASMMGHDLIFSRIGTRMHEKGLGEWVPAQADEKAEVTMGLEKQDPGNRSSILVQVLITAQDLQRFDAQNRDDPTHGYRLGIDVTRDTQGAFFISRKVPNGLMRCPDIADRFAVGDRIVEINDRPLTSLEFLLLGQWLATCLRMCRTFGSPVKIQLQREVSE